MSLGSDGAKKNLKSGKNKNNLQRNDPFIKQIIILLELNNVHTR